MCGDTVCVRESARQRERARQREESDREREKKKRQREGREIQRETERQREGQREREGERAREREWITASQSWCTSSSSWSATTMTCLLLLLRPPAPVPVATGWFTNGDTVVGSFEGVRRQHAARMPNMEPMMNAPTTDPSTIVKACKHNMA